MGRRARSISPLSKETFSLVNKSAFCLESISLHGRTTFTDSSVTRTALYYGQLALSESDQKVIWAKNLLPLRFVCVIKLLLHGV